MKKTLAIFTLIAVAIVSDAQTLSGSWTGVLSFGNSEIRLVLHFRTGDNGNTECTMDSPDQGAKDIPGVIRHLSEDSLSIDFPTVGARYNGAVNAEDNSFSGVFSQSGMSFGLKMSPGEIKVNRPQTPEPPFPYMTEEISFENPEAEAVLSGTLTYPVGFEKGKPVPAVLMITGSGQQNRDEEIQEHKPFAVIADYLARNGIASLRYDDRGTGLSTGDASGSTTLDNMRDALAGLEFLKKKGIFSKTGVLGHSEGGLIAFMIGGRHPDSADFIVSLAGSAVRGDRIIVEQNRKILLQGGMSQKTAEDYCNVLESIYSYKASHSRIENGISVMDSIIEFRNADLEPQAKLNLLGILCSSVPWLDFFISYDPSEDISNIACPVMAINGSLDSQVISGTNLDALRKLLPQNGDSEIKEYPGLNHLFQHCETGSPLEYGRIEETFSEEVLKDIADWINLIDIPN